MCAGARSGSPSLLQVTDYHHIHTGKKSGTSPLLHHPYALNPLRTDIHKSRLFSAGCLKCLQCTEGTVVHSTFQNIETHEYN